MDKIGIAVGSAQMWFARLIFALMPSQHETITVDSFDWRDIRNTVGISHVIFAFLGAGIAFVLTILLKRLAFFNISVLGIINSAAQFTATNIFGIQDDITYITTGLVIVLLIMWKPNVQSLFGIGPAKLISGLPGLAMSEELMFRAGSENWSVYEKIRACFAFGLMHLTMIIVPLTVALALTFPGAVFMFVYLSKYRRTTSAIHAVRASATVHTVYNLLIIILLFALILWSLFI